MVPRPWRHAHSAFIGAASSAGQACFGRARGSLGSAGGSRGSVGGSRGSRGSINAPEAPSDAPWLLSWTPST